MITPTRSVVGLILLGIGLVVVLVGWRLMYGGDARTIERVFDRAMELVNKGGPEGELTAVGRAAELAGLFATPFRIQPLPDVSRAEIVDAEALRAAIFRVRSSVDSIDVRVLDRKVEVDSAGGEAVMVMAVQGAFDGNPIFREEIYRFRVLWKKVDGDWKIGEVRSEDTIRRPGR